MSNTQLISVVAFSAAIGAMALPVTAGVHANRGASSEAGYDVGESVFEAVQSPQAQRGQAGQGRNANALRGKSRSVRMNRAALGKARMRLNLGVGPDLDVVRERLVERGNGRKAWIGRVAGDADSEVILVSSGQAVAGSIRHNGHLYKLRPAAGGVQQLEEVEPGDPKPSLELVPDLPGTATTVAVTADAPVGEVSIVDVLVAYTPEARNSYGGTDGILALIGLAVEETNQAYLNSDAPMQLRLAGTTETDYHDSGDMNADLTRMTTFGDGYLDEIPALRDSVGADVVSLLVGSGYYCGLSWQMGVLSPAYAAYAFNVVHTSCAAGYYSFGHEIGHNLGLSHDHANAYSGVFPYSFGWQDPNNSFRTVMAYDCTGGCVRVPHFSNPEISYAGAPTGEVDWADNALALADTAPLVATWRQDVTLEVPLAPTGLGALAVGYDRIDLSWNDEADNETGYRVERSADGVNFSLIATLAANSVAFSDQPLSPDTTWFYRVSAVNGSGVSLASNQAWATTEPAPMVPPTAPSALSTTALSHSEIALSWNDQSADETGFELERSLDNGQSWAALATLGANVTAYTDQGLTAETAYGYRVRAIGVGGASAYSNSILVTTPAEPVYPPVAPSDLEAQGVSTSEITLNWQDNAADETGYGLERSSNGGTSWTLITLLGANAEGYVDTGLQAGTYYLYRVQAIGAGGASEYSNQAGASTEAEPVTCNVSGADRLRLKDKDAKWKLTNTGSVDLTVSAIEITWPSAQGYLKKIKLDRDEIWSGVDQPTAASIDSGWHENASRRVLRNGDSRELKFQFSIKYKNDRPEDYSIRVDFSEGCSVQF